MSRLVISLIVATYNVAPYLPEFLASLDRQTVGKDAFEVVFVDDGSPDQSGRILADWGRVTACTQRVITIENGGVANARNTGIDVARGEWLTFCDPDDVLADDYLEIMLGAVGTPGAGAPDLAVGNFIYLDHETGRLRDRHPLRFRFEEGDQTVDLERRPTFIQLATNTGLFRRSVVEEHHIRFDPRIRPVFEDAHFTGVYLSKFERPQVAVRQSAVYRYRRGRSDGTSLMQGAWASEGKFLAIPEYGWLDLLQQVRAERGRVPAWAQNMVLYDLFWYLKKERRGPSPLTGHPAAVTTRFHELLAAIAPYLERENIEQFQVNPVPYELRMALAFGLKGAPSGPPRVTVDKVDRAHGLARYSYYFAGAPPAESIRADGRAIAPVYAKIRTHRFAGKIMMYERIAWLPADSAVTIDLDGAAAEIDLGPLHGRRRPAAAAAAAKCRRALVRVRAAARPASRRATLLGARRVVRARLARSVLNRRYAHAWVLVDRDGQAQDNAEHLYRYLCTHQPSVNAFFVLDPGSPDWSRLERDGFRLLAHGSREHTTALLNADHLISSQLDRDIVEPPDVRRFRPHRWRYTFLQHGAAGGDSASWISSETIERMITATPRELESIAGDYTPSAFTTREVRLTGYPRHDRLLRLGRDGGGARTILVMPTWRRRLGGATAGPDGPTLVAAFWQTPLALAWRALLEDEELQALSRRTGWTIVFVPHPLMEQCLLDNPLPDHVRTRRLGDVDLQETIASAAVLVTDYSSSAFDAAYVQRPVVYYQFDAEETVDGPHSYGQGDWSYPDDGFGPVVSKAAEAVRQIAELAGRDGRPAELYAQRMERAFPYRDGRCCERTYEAICELDRPLPDDQRYRAVTGRGDPIERTVSDGGR